MTELMKKSDILCAGTVPAFGANLESFSLRITDSGYYEMITKRWGSDNGMQEKVMDGKIPSRALDSIKSAKGLIIQVQKEDRVIDDAGQRYIVMRLKDGSEHYVSQCGTDANRKAKNDPFEKIWSLINDVIDTQQSGSSEPHPRPAGL